ncbi:MAG: patatin-like phospholipase family protein [Acidimicrobiales bacterium]|nr:patatin-like phospholipase family protein [Acidimicrobiales bacterium]
MSGVTFLRPLGYPPPPSIRKPTTGLVLGAGGRAGLAHHAGALHALTASGALDIDDLDIIIGTSAGAIVGAQLRCGVTPEELYDMALDDTEEGARRRGDDFFAPAWDSALSLAQRALGSSWVLGRSLLRFPLPVLPRQLRTTFPGGLMQLSENADLDAHLPREWPERHLWLVSVDIHTGRRVVLRRDGPVGGNLQQAALASAAVPGIYQPVRLNGRTLVDGGVHSNTNLDLLLGKRLDHITVIAPLGLSAMSPVPPPLAAVRQFVHTNLMRIVESLRAQGTTVAVLEPSADMARAHGVNTLRIGASAEIAEAAYSETVLGLSDLVRETDRPNSLAG